MKIDSYINADVKVKLEDLLTRYATKRAALLEVLHIVMAEQGHITLEMEEAIAEYLEISSIDVREVVTFYTLYYTKEKAQTRFNVCRTLSCTLMGANDVIQHIENRLGIKPGEQTKDGKFSLNVVECLGACEIAPMLQLNDKEFKGCLTKEKVDDLIEQSQTSTQKA